MKKYIEKYTKLYKIALNNYNMSDIDAKAEAFAKRLTDMYASPAFAQHNIYPTVNVHLVYAVIAMCLELKSFGYSDNDAMQIANSGFEKRRNSFAVLYNIINMLPFSYKIAEKWNISDHEKRVNDGSIVYDYFNVSPGKLEYRITRCAYIDIFEYYGIRNMCKVFCLTDEYAYAHIPRNVQFIRHSDLCDGDCCHDEIIDRNFHK